MVRGRSKSGSKAGKSKGKARPDEDHFNAIPQSLHQRKKRKITTNLKDVQVDMMAEWSGYR